ncbi:hypothetical protein HELRODRAFT_183073 [Helobdella robusta]|uniref:Uncharacterized protein n=1 Tax=Helobdella robusta TaxID=6412 RepID=T1FJ46_HELRO|nr:hypothetical protein HELRODRAFT_183073 [Helobdella robusta]ESN89868.1 hypothetical protein HELRODRAFT_183073 [Helobdella robusta]
MDASNKSKKVGGTQGNQLNNNNILSTFHHHDSPARFTSTSTVANIKMLPIISTNIPQQNVPLLTSNSNNYSSNNICNINKNVTPTIILQPQVMSMEKGKEAVNTPYLLCFIQQQPNNNNNVAGSFQQFKLLPQQQQHQGSLLKCQDFQSLNQKTYNSNNISISNFQNVVKIQNQENIRSNPPQGSKEKECFFNASTSPYVSDIIDNISNNNTNNNTISSGHHKKNFSSEAISLIIILIKKCPANSTLMLANDEHRADNINIQYNIKNADIKDKKTGNIINSSLKANKINNDIISNNNSNISSNNYNIISSNNNISNNNNNTSNNNSNNNNISKNITSIVDLYLINSINSNNINNNNNNYSKTGFSDIIAGSINKNTTTTTPQETSFN